jgi:hypothetical protein
MASRRPMMFEYSYVSGKTSAVGDVLIYHTLLNKVLLFR